MTMNRTNARRPEGRATWLFNLLCDLLACVVVALPLAAAAEPRGLERLPEQPEAPAFDLPDVDGERHRLADYRGKVVIVNFWATWCPPCRREMPSMERAWQELKGGPYAMLGINVGESADQVFTFTADYPVAFPLLLDREANVIDEWPVLGLPTTFVVDPKGRIVYRAVGGREWDEPRFMEAIRELASTSSKSQVQSSKRNGSSE